MDVSVVVTCWNGRKLLEKNLPKVLEASKDPRNQILEVVVVDDGSADDSVEFIESFKDARRFGGFQSFKVRLFKHEKNLGYSATCNTGVREAKGELVAILNLDVAPSVNFLESALPLFADNTVFSVSFNEGKFGPGRLFWKKGFLEIEDGGDIPEKTAPTDWPSGGSSVFRKSQWEKLGGMDRLFLPFYFEDIDLGLRARRAGLKCLWEPRAKVEHEHEATINAYNFRQKYIDRIKQRNQLLITWKNINNPGLFLAHLFYLKLKCLLHPGYFKILLLALKRRFFTVL